MDPQLHFTFKRDDVLDTSKGILTFPRLELFSWFKRIENHLSIAIGVHFLLNRSAKLWFCSFINAPVWLRGPLSPASFLMSQPIFKWNKLPLCSAQGRIHITTLTTLKPAKVTLLTMILYHSENGIHHIRPFCRPLFCHSNVVKYTSSLLQYSSEPVMRLDYQILLKSPPTLTGWIHPWSACEQ